MPYVTVGNIIPMHWKICWIIPRPNYRPLPGWIM